MHSGIRVGRWLAAALCMAVSLAFGAQDDQGGTFYDGASGDTVTVTSRKDGGFDYVRTDKSGRIVETGSVDECGDGETGDGHGVHAKVSGKDGERDLTMQYDAWTDEDGGTHGGYCTVYGEVPSA